MSTADQKLAAELHGTALLAAQDPALQPLLDRLADLAEGLDDVRTKTAGELAGGWFAAPGRHIGHEAHRRWFVDLVRRDRPRPA